MPAFVPGLAETAESAPFEAPNPVLWAAGLALTGLAELLLAVITGSVFLGFRVSKRPTSRSHRPAVCTATRTPEPMRPRPGEFRQLYLIELLTGTHP